MPMLTRPPEYRSLGDLLSRRVIPTFRVLATMGYQLADSHVQLHIDGRSCRSISFDTVFFRPDTGDVLICDNDESGGGIAGTPRFMAPEIVRREALPSAHTDLFSLAVLLFYLFFCHHPLEGAKEVAVDTFDVEEEYALYGSNPIFIFDPRDTSNAPVPGYQDAPLFYWPLYPAFLHELFTRAFTIGLNPQNERAHADEWCAAMIRLRDAIFYCSLCQAENFYDAEAFTQQEGHLSTCWQCHQSTTLPFRLRISNQVVMLNHDTKLYPHHLDSQRKWDFSRPAAEVVRHPTDSQVWGLKNLSDAAWVLTRAGNSLHEVERQRSATLAAGVKINFGNTAGEIRY